MKMVRWAMLGLAALLVTTSAACSTEGPVVEEVVAAPSESTPEEVIESFLRWYAGYPGNPLADGVLVTNSVVTEALVEKVDAILASFGPGGYDPILCAQDRPQSFTVEVTDRSPDTAAAVVRTEFEGHKIYVGAMKVDGQWMIADVTCPADPSPSPSEEEDVIGAETPSPIPTLDPADQEPDDEASDDKASEIDLINGWPIFRDDVYGFQIAHPPGWGFMDLPVYDPGAGGPPTVIERFIIFYPEAWEERLKPGGEPDPNAASYPAFSIEVCVGTLESYRREFMELAASETIQTNGLGVLHEWDTYDDHNIARYVFQHPSNDELRITLTDAVSGFAARAAENQDVVTLIPQVVSTFRFTE